MKKKLKTKKSRTIKVKGKSPKTRHRKVKYRRKRLKIINIMTKKVIVGNDTSNLAEVAQIFIDKHISHLPIMKENKLAGIISVTDVLKAANVADLSELDENNIKQLSAVNTSDVMKKPIYVYINAPLIRARKLMKKYNISSIPVLDKGKNLVGIITKTDLVRTLSKIFIGRHIQTTVDELLKTLETFGSMPIDKLASMFGVKPDLIEEWGKILEEHDIVTVVYPTFGKPYLKINKKEPS